MSDAYVRWVIAQMSAKELRELLTLMRESLRESKPKTRRNRPPRPRLHAFV